MRVLFALLLTLWCSAAVAQTGQGAAYGPGPCPFDASSCTSRATGTPTAISEAARSAFTVIPQNFGAVADGNSHTASSTLGISTLAGLVAYASNGTTPYSWAGTYPFGQLFNVPVAQTAIMGATTLNFTTTQTTANSALAGAYIIPMTDIAGIAQGAAVSGANITAGTQVEFVQPSPGNTSTAFIWLSKPVAIGGLTNGETLTFSRPELSRLTTGTWTVSGVGITNGTTVSTVNTGTGVVTLSLGTTAALYTNTLNTAGTPHYESSTLTFYRAYTDAEAAALTMDFLGTQAAIQALATSGGSVHFPTGTYKYNSTLVIPTGSVSFGDTTTNIHLVGDGRNAVYLEPTADFGWHVPLLSCGDPSATMQNGRGIFAPLSGTPAYCAGKFTDVTLLFPGTSFAYGLRPTVGGVPIGMDGLLQGPRRDMDRVSIYAFNNGDHFTGDHTHWTDIILQGDFSGLYFESGNGGVADLKGDYLFTFPTIFGNAFCDICVAPESLINDGHLDHPYLTYAPYAIYKMPGTATGSVGNNFLANLQIDSYNFESNGLGIIVDGNKSADESGGITAVQNVVLENGTAPGENIDAVPVGGGTWYAYYDLWVADGFILRDFSHLSYKPVTGAQALIRAARTLGGGSGSNADYGIVMSGVGMTGILSDYGAISQQLVSGAAGSESNLAFGGWLNVKFESPGSWTGHLLAVNSTAFNSSMAAGAVLEGAPSLTSASITGRPSGTGTLGTFPIMGVNLEPWAGSPNSKFTVVASVGQHLPVAVAAAESVGSLLKVAGSPNAGQGVAATSVADGQTLGVVTDANNGSTSLVYVRSMIQGQQ